MPQGYVYPVRSLFTGIQSAADSNSGRAEESADPLTSGSHKTSSTISSKPLMESSSNDSQSKAKASMDAGGGGESSSFYRRLSTGLKKRTRLRGIDSLPYEVDNEQHTSRRERRRAPNFVDYPVGQDPLAPRTFVSGHVSPPAEPMRLGTLPGPTGEPVPFDPNQLSEDPDDYLVRHSHPVSEVVAEAFVDEVDIAPSTGRPATGASFISNFSQSGIVHLAPIERGGSPGSRTRSVGTGGSGSAGATSRAGTSRGSGGGSASSNSNQGDIDVVQMPSTRSSRPLSPLSGSAKTSSQSTSGGSSSEGPHITFRYQHMEDENGHHLIVGREGTLTRCEDEPIRTPGAVQGFGVLVALQEDEDTGNLLVRQVSEVLQLFAYMLVLL